MEIAPNLVKVSLAEVRCKLMQVIEAEDKSYQAALLLIDARSITRFPAALLRRRRGTCSSVLDARVAKSASQLKWGERYTVTLDAYIRQSFYLTDVCVWVAAGNFAKDEAIVTTPLPPLFGPAVATHLPASAPPLVDPGAEAHLPDSPDASAKRAPEASPSTPVDPKTSLDHEPDQEIERIVALLEPPPSADEIILAVRFAQVQNRVALAKRIRYKFPGSWTTDVARRFGAILRTTAD